MNRHHNHYAFANPLAPTQPELCADILLDASAGRPMVPPFRGAVPSLCGFPTGPLPVVPCCVSGTLALSTDTLARYPLIPYYAGFNVTAFSHNPLLPVNYFVPLRRCFMG